jgi:serine/threonine-protein kinase
MYASVQERSPVVIDLDEQRERARAAREALIGKTIAGKYILRGLVGHGGMGAVYDAEHVGLGKRVAIKFVDAEFATDENVVARFAREARAMSAIESAHIVTVFDAGSDDGRPYLVMELLRGEDLGERLRRLGRVPLGEAMHVVAQVLRGLARAHAAGIIHRDLKPDNVFLVKSDTDPLFAKIVDFGISKIERPRDKTHPLALTGRGTVLGTPFYMSPEQAQALPDVDGRTDLYSVGAILFECLTGRPPHTGESYEQVILSICMRDAPDVRTIEPSIPIAASAFVARALCRDRGERFASAERMLAALHDVAPEERTRVPLDVPAVTLASAAANPLEATLLDGSPPLRSSRPSAEPAGAATRLGVGTLESARDEVIGGGAVAAKEAAAERAPAAAGAKAEAKPAAKRPSGARTSKPQKRPIGVAVATAAVATLMGVGVTFGVIAMLEKKPPGEAVRPTAPMASAPPSASATTTVTIASGTASAAASVPGPTATGPAAAPAASPASVSTASAKPSTSPSGRPGPRGTSVPALPRPTSTKPLDIQRDLP